MKRLELFVGQGNDGVIACGTKRGIHGANGGSRQCQKRGGENPPGVIKIVRSGCVSLMTA